MIYKFKALKEQFSLLRNNKYELLRGLVSNLGGNQITISATSGAVNAEPDTALNKQKIEFTVTTNVNSDSLSSLNSDQILPFNTYRTIDTQVTYSTNVHQDLYSTTNEIGLQSPFTNQFVGGNQHRHLPINSGSDTSATRPELYKNENNILSSVGATSPKGVFYRQERVKRPVNIRNVATNTASNIAGNFQNNYQVISIAGRTENHPSFVNNNGFLAQGTASTYISGHSDYPVTSQSSNQTIIVNRFSSPGGLETSNESLDRVAEEYSSYNSVNFRNLVARRSLNKWLAETASADDNNFSYHKTNANGALALQLSGSSSATVVTRSTYDNWFINRQIPRTDKNYAWINAASSGGIGYILVDMPSQDFSTTYTFVTGATSSLGFIDFVGTNISVVQSIDTSSNLITIPQTNNLNSYLLNLHGAYQSPSWKQIRGYTNPLVNIFRKNNILSVQDESSGKLLQTATNFKEPPVEFNKPLRIVYSSSYNGEDILSEYSNELDFFANPDLISRFTSSLLNNKETTYDNLKQLSTLNNLTNNPIYKFKFIEYKEVLFPKKENIGFSSIRNKASYSEVAGTGSNGYDRNIAKIRSFWKKNYLNRARTSGYNSLTKTGSINSLNYPFVSSSENYFYNSYAPTSLLFRGTKNISVTASSLYLSSSILANDKYPNTVYYSSSYTDGKIIITSSLFGELSLYEDFELKKTILLPSGSVQTTKDPSTFVNYTVYNFKYDNSFFRFSPRPQFAYKILNNNGVVFTGLEYKTDVLSNNSPWYDSYDEYLANILPLSSKFSLIPEYKISDFMDYFIKQNNGNFLASYNGEFLNYDGVSDQDLESISNTNDFNNFLIEDSLPNKKLKIKLAGIKKLLPYKGFYPSERSEQVVNIFADSFFGLDSNEILTGAVSLSPGDNAEGTPLDQQVATVIQPFFAPGILFNTIKAGIATSWESIITNNSSSYLNKPTFYSGFYNWLSSKSSSVINAQESNFHKFNFESILDINSSIPESKKSGTLHFLHPDLYNITSSGDNVRYPSYYIGDKYNKYNKNWSEKNPLYRLAINNFLAEIPTFFLKGEKLNNFISKPQKDIGSVVSGTTYFMDIFVKKHENYKTFINSLTHSLDVNLSGELSSSRIAGSVFENGSMYYGPSIKNIGLGASDLSSILYSTALNDMADPYQHKYNPPYYLGKSLATLSYTADITGRVSLKDIISKLNINYTNDLKNVKDLALYLLFAVANYKPTLNLINDSGSIIEPMNLESSINFKQLTNIKNLKYDQYGNPLEITEPLDDNYDVWSIQTKFETPILNFNNDLNKSVLLNNEQIQVSGVILSGIARLSSSIYYSSIGGESDGYGGGLLSTTNVEPYDFVSSSSGLYVVGKFTKASNIEKTNKIALWDGGKWNSVGGGLPDVPQIYNTGSSYITNGLESYPTCIFSSSNGLYVSGYRVTIPNDSSLYEFSSSWTPTYVILWDGNKWNIIGDKIYGLVKTITSGASGLYIGGFLPDLKNVARLNTSTSRWETVGTGLTASSYIVLPDSELGIVETLITSSAGIYAGGYFQSSGSLIARWNGSSWLSVAGGIPTGSSIVYPAGGNGVTTLVSGTTGIYAAGVFSGSVSGSSISRFNGTSWSSLGYADLLGLKSLITASSGLYVGENYYGTAGKVKYYNGTTWAEVGETLKAQITCLASGSGVLYIGGRYLSGTVDRPYKITAQKIQNDIGLWSGYGEVPNTGEGVVFGLSETYEKQNSSTGSLIKLCGFESGQRDIGSIAENKEISEAVILIPYVDKGNENLENNEYAKNILSLIGENNNTNTNRENGPFYFKVDSDVIDEILQTQFKNTTPDQLSKILKKNTINHSNSIVKSMSSMINYILPPHMDWITNKNIDPFVMYIFEFKHTLDQQDLSDIWQGLMPKIAKNPEFEEISIEHSLDKSEFFHGKKIPQNVKFKIFKIKKRGKMSYYELTDDSSDDTRFKFDFANQKTTPDYSYNYPYDFFSLVEMINVEVGSEVSDEPVQVKKYKTIPKIKSLEKKLIMNKPIELQDKLYPILPTIGNALANNIANSVNSANKKLFDIKTTVGGVYDTTVSLGQNISVGTIVATSSTGAKIKSPVAGKVSYINDKVGNEGRINASTIIFKIEV